MSERASIERAPSTVGSAPGSAGWAAYLRAVGAIVWKDLVAELRSRQLVGAMLVFSLIVILVFNFALELQVQLRAEISAGVLWVTLAFAGTLGLNRSMAVEQERGCLDGLLLTPVDRSAMYFGKALANLIFMVIVAVVVLPLFGALYNVNLLRPGLLMVTLLGMVGYAAVGTLLATMAVQTRIRDVLLPILLFPVVLPVLIAAVNASKGYLTGLAAASIRPWVNLLLVYDVIFLSVAMMFFESVVQE